MARQYYTFFSDTPFVYSAFYRRNLRSLFLDNPCILIPWQQRLHPQLCVGPTSHHIVLVEKKKNISEIQNLPLPFPLIIKHPCVGKEIFWPSTVAKERQHMLLCPNSTSMHWIEKLNNDPSKHIHGSGWLIMFNNWVIAVLINGKSLQTWASNIWLLKLYIFANAVLNFQNIYKYFNVFFESFNMIM